MTEHQHHWRLEHVQLRCDPLDGSGCRDIQRHTGEGEVITLAPGQQERATRETIEMLVQGRLRALRERDEARAELARLRAQRS